MRRLLPILLCLAAWTACPAQKQEEGMLARMSSSTTRAIQAINTGKEDKTLENPMNGKKFEGSNKLVLRKSASESRSFVYEERNLVSEYRQTRSFLGIKNPWLGKMVYETRDAPLWAKSVVKNSDKTVDVSSATTREFPQAEKSAPARQNLAATATRPFIQQGGLMGMPQQITGKLGQDMTIDEVREILNKNK